MIQRGRKSAENLVVIQGAIGARPEPPEDLNERQKEIWRETVACEPAEHFATAATRAMLKDYCEHSEAGEKLTAIINSFQPEWIKNAEGAKRYGDLLKMRELENRAATMLATRLRITNQSRYGARAADTASRNVTKGLRPWET